MIILTPSWKWAKQKVRGIHRWHWSTSNWKKLGSMVCLSMWRVCVRRGWVSVSENMVLTKTADDGQRGANEWRVFNEKWLTNYSKPNSLDYLSVCPCKQYVVGNLISTHGQCASDTFQDQKQIDCYQHMPSISISLRHGFYSALIKLVLIQVRTLGWTELTHLNMSSPNWSMCERVNDRYCPRRRTSYDWYWQEDKSDSNSADEEALLRGLEEKLAPYYRRF